MATDIARISFDPARHYTGVAPQQGRVTLEAEENEERVILAAERRAELLDLIGPAGTPDDGYAVSSPGGFDLQIGAGTMYVGGVRVTLDAPILYSDQPDWLDHDGDPEFVPVPTDVSPGNEHVVLVLTGTDVTATEDPVLREVALGGPDGAARTRILQRIHRFATQASDCADALAGDVQAWLEQGLAFDPTTMAVLSDTRLLVSPDPPPQPQDVCQPSSKGGYLGAENQAIRVQVHAVNNDGTFDLLWGWDNASFLYRVTPDQSTDPVLTLDRSPVNDFHRPRAGQPVQLLRSAAQLVTTDGTIEGYVAELEGQVGVLTAPYDPDTKTVQFPAPVPAQYTDPAATPQLYMRVWQELIPGNVVGTAIPLTGTGLSVTISLTGGASTPHVGDHWTIGVRPATPDSVLPARLLRTPQPPDGPRMRACPLAVIGWLNGVFELLDDCRIPYPRQLDECCCTVSVQPGDLGEKSLQQIIDDAVAQRAPNDRAHSVTVCLCPGRYQLPRPLVLDNRHNHLHLEGCGEGVVLAAVHGTEQEFAQGLIELVHADNVRISGLELQLPQVPAAAAKIRPQERELRKFQRPLAGVYRDLFVSIGIRPVHCAVLEIDHCLFRFTVGVGQTTAETEQTAARNVFGVGIFAASECWGLRVESNRFLHEAAHETIRMRGAVAAGQASPVEAESFVSGELTGLHVLVGLLLAPSLVYRSSKSSAAQRLPSGALVRALITRGRIRDNEFGGLTAAALLFAEIGDLRIEDNTAHDCYAGFVTYSLRATAFADLAGDYTVAAGVKEEVLSAIGQVIVSGATDEQLMIISVIARTYPLPDTFITGAADRLVAAHMVAESNKVDQIPWMQQFLDQAVAPFVDAPAPGAQRAARQKAPQPSTFTAGGVPAPTAPRQRAVQQTHALLSDYERAAAFEPPTRDFELRVTGNDVECTLAILQRTGPALFVWETDKAQTSSALVTDNRLSGAAVVVAALLRVPEVIAGNNIVRNLTPERYSLALLGTSAVAQVTVTGNLLLGRTALPPRPLASPMNTWDPLNTVL